MCGTIHFCRIEQSQIVWAIKEFHQLIQIELWGGTLLFNLYSVGTIT